MTQIVYTYSFVNSTVAFADQVQANFDTVRSRFNALVASNDTLTPGAAVIQKRVAPAYGPAVAIDASLGNEFDITATNGVAFTVSNPTNAVDGELITITIRNTSGGALGAVTWDTLYKLAAWTSPATGFSRSITFKYNGTNWVEISRTTVDVPN